ncbi:hypothetical protein NFI96_000668 [Prochilodus magdalenae]|nr:hypothetical protein NFI96_000668 [Prochilodus magdalenae]
MFPGFPVSSKASASTSPLPLLSPLALCDLARSETELKQLQEQQAAEAKAVGQTVERALLGAQREERRLLERVEQDHRDLQCRLEQVQRDNAASFRVGQALADQRLHKISQLREEISKRSKRHVDCDRDGHEVKQKRDRLLKAAAELLQPWEISLAFKRVFFKPSAQPKAVNFGVVKVQDHNVNFSVGSCGSQGQLCSLHATEKQCESQSEPGREGSTPDGAGPGQGQGQLFLVDCGNARVQVTDQYGNVLQQVTSPSKDAGDSSRRCRNYFDVAVSAKGLIALSCATERALLIFSRHGRLLQTFGGGPYIAGVPRDELEAPRGVTVTQKDEFLVADIPSHAMFLGVKHSYQQLPLPNHSQASSRSGMQEVRGQSVVGSLPFPSTLSNSHIAIIHTALPSLSS